MIFGIATSRGYPVRPRSTTALLLFGLALLAGLLPVASRAQTLARPGWAGSGMKVAQWWRNSVIVEVSPGGAEAGSVLGHTRLQLGDLQTLGTDAILLRGLDTGAAGKAGEPQLAGNYGTMDEFDQLMREASGRRMRLMVELPAGLTGAPLLGDARFWLNRGVSGLALPTEASGSDETVRALRGVLHGYVGERVLAAEAAMGGAAAGGATGARAGSGPDLVFAVLPGFGAVAQATDVAAVRTAIDGAARRGGTGVSVAALDPKAPPVTGGEAKARATALLMVRGSVALRAQDVGVGPEEQARMQEAERDAVEKRAIETATSPAAASNARRAAAARKATAPSALELPGDATFSWYSRMIGMHRGNPAMLGGEQTMVNEDEKGALVAVWQGRGGQPLVAVVNLRGEPCTMDLKEDFARLRLRGLFLRTVVRTDLGMGAMPLAKVSLPGYGVYLGQLGR